MITNEEYKKLQNDEQMSYDDDENNDNHDINDIDNDEDNDTVHYDEMDDNDDSDIDDAECDVEYNVKTVRMDEDVITENECEADAYSSPEDGNIPDSDTDESISVTTGYRKKSLGR